MRTSSLIEIKSEGLAGTGTAPSERPPMGVDSHDLFRAFRAEIVAKQDPFPVSSGCIRLFNQDIIDLTNHVPFGAPGTVVQG